MSRISLMTCGLLLILIGVQLNLVDSFVLTSRATKFWKSKLSSSPFEDEGGGAASNPVGLQASRQPAPGTSFSNQYAARPNFPYTTPNYRRYRNGGRGLFQTGARNSQNRLNNGNFQNAGFGSPVNGVAANAASQPRFPGQKMITPPTWICWPPIFLGAVIFLFGAARP